MQQATPDGAGASVAAATQSKSALRENGYAARAAQADKDSASAAICAAFVALSAYRRAATVMWYCHCRTEVRTLPALAAALQSFGKRLVVPYCTQDAQGTKVLGIWQVQDLQELTPGMWGILEPPPACRDDTARSVAAAAVDLVMVPGVAFDRRGGRLGNGQGYYDRLLRALRSDCVRCGVAYESQLCAAVPMQEHDVHMDYVITESAVYCANRR